MGRLTLGLVIGDCAADAHAGKRTLMVRWGAGVARRIYLGLITLDRYPSIMSWWHWPQLRT